MLQELLEILHGQAVWLPCSLGCILDGNQLHGVALYRQITTPHGVVQ